MVEINDEDVSKLVQAINNIAREIEERSGPNYDELVDVLREIRDELDSLGSVLVGVATAIGYLEKVKDEK